MTDLLVVGCGQIAHRYFDAVRLLPELRIIACVDSDETRIKDLDSGGFKCFTSIEQALDVYFDAALILTPNFLHAKNVRDVLERGYDVLCEKPLALSPEKAQELINIARANGCFLYPAMHSRFRPEVSYMRGQNLTDITYFEHRWEENWSQSPIWYHDRNCAGGGVLLDVGINHIDWLMDMTEELKPLKVEFGWGKGDVEQDCCVTWQFQNGTGVSCWSWRAKREIKETILHSYRSGRYVLDHINNRIIHNGATIGSWQNREYLCVLKNFLEKRAIAHRTIESDAVRNLFMLRHIYSIAGVPFLTNMDRSCEQ